MVLARAGGTVLFDTRDQFSSLDTGATSANGERLQAILANIRDAKNRAECALVSLHTHEGSDENWYTPRVASFIEEFAHQAVEAGFVFMKTA